MDMDIPVRDLFGRIPCTLNLSTRKLDRAAGFGELIRGTQIATLTAVPRRPTYISLRYPLF